jgi:hypothetical protein
MYNILISEKIINLSYKFKLFNTEFNSGSFSIIPYLKGYLINLRCINYKKTNSEFLINTFNNYNCITINKFIKLDLNFNKIDENKLIIPNLLSILIKKKNNNNIKRILGIEDMRMFVYNNKIKIIGSSELNNNLYIISGDYDYLNNKLLNINYIKPTFNYQSVEKNWVYFINKNKLEIIYKWYPLQICNLNINKKKFIKDLNLIKEIPMCSFFKNARGSTCGVYYNNEIWFICHFNLNGSYSHFFVVFNIDMIPIRYSNVFYFEISKIQFCIGLYIMNNGTFLIPYSINDVESKLGIYNISTINNMIWNNIP